MLVMKRRPFILALAFMGWVCSVPLLMAEGLDADSAAGGAMFDGTPKYLAKVAAKPFPPAADKKMLATQLRMHMTLEDHGNPEEKAALEAVILRMMDSPTARELAVKFANENARAVVSFSEIPGSTVVMVDGKETLWGTHGFTLLDRTPPVVKINKYYMQHDKDLAVRVLAHEMMGHALEKKRTEGGLGDDRMLNVDEEESARLIGWLVGAELYVKPEDEVWTYLDNPEEWREASKMWSIDYSLTLTTPEMKNPVPVYKARLAAAFKASQQLQQQNEARKTFDRWIDHFITVHKMTPDSFRALRESFDNFVKDLPRVQKLHEDIQAALQNMLTSISSDDGKRFLSELAKDAENPYFTRKDAAITQRRVKLEGLMMRKQNSVANPPPVNGQLSFDDLNRLIENEDKCPFGGLK
ncbi:MAG: hypothetical protein WCW52_09720 [Elusimicrobiales bacterium]